MRETKLFANNPSAISTGGLRWIVNNSVFSYRLLRRCIRDCILISHFLFDYNKGLSTRHCWWEALQLKTEEKTRQSLYNCIWIVKTTRILRGKSVNKSESDPNIVARGDNDDEVLFKHVERLHKFLFRRNCTMHTHRQQEASRASRATTIERVWSRRNFVVTAAIGENFVRILTRLGVSHTHIRLDGEVEELSLEESLKSWCAVHANPTDMQFSALLFIRNEICVAFISCCFRCSRTDVDVANQPFNSSAIFTSRCIFFSSPSSHPTKEEIICGAFINYFLPSSLFLLSAQSR